MRPITPALHLHTPPPVVVIDAINRWLLVFYIALTLVLWARAGPSLTAAAFTVGLILLHSAGLLLYRQRGDVRRLAVVSHTLETGLLLFVSWYVEQDLSTMLLSIASAGIILRYHAWLAFPAVLGGFTLYIVLVEPEAWWQGNYVLRLLGFTIWHVAFFGVRILIAQRQQILDLNRQIQTEAALMAEMTRLRERNQLAEAMHDTIGHALTSAIVSLEGAALLLARCPADAAALVDSAREQLQVGLGDLRQTVRNLRTDGLSDQLTLRESLERLVERIVRQTAIRIVLRHQVRADLLPIQEYVCFTVIREGLTNALRHGRPTTITIEIAEVAPACIALSVADDGVGARAPDPGFGLTHLRQKVEALGGSLAVDTAAQAGFRLYALMPLAFEGAAPRGPAALGQGSGYD